MRIVTWNINSLRLRMDLMGKLQSEHSPDIICLQEIKTSDETFPVEGVRALGYEHVVYSGEKSYNGVAILSKYPITDNFCLSFYNQDKRHIAAKIHDFEIHNFYVPAGGDIPDTELNPKFKHKLAYLDWMKSWFKDNRNISDKIILTGDLNIAPHEHDVWSSKQLKNVVSHTGVERKVLIDLQESFNFIDSGRHFVDYNEKLYTWWSYRTPDWKKSNRGRRLDHIWVSESLKDRLHSISSIGVARGWERPSDHVPFILDLI